MAVPKTDCKTIIPVTIESANRTGDNTKAHPLCDQLRYLAPFGGEKFTAYQEQLNRWADSPYSHPKVRAIRRYIVSGAIVRDLTAVGVITLDENGDPGKGKIEGISFENCLIRWRVVPAPEGGSSACWRDQTLFRSFAAYYAGQREGEERGLCMITGSVDFVCDMHPKGVLAYSNGAKLISANDSTGFTYRGRFTQPGEAVSVGYDASQKVHSALRWLTVNHGVSFGNRAFCAGTRKAPRSLHLLCLDCQPKRNRKISSAIGRRLPKPSAAIGKRSGRRRMWWSPHWTPPPPAGCR